MEQAKNVIGKLGLWGLVALVISSMVGSGVYSLPQNMAQGANVDAIVIAWVITGAGMFFVTETFRMLSAIKPDMTSGIYSYSQDGFGPLAGFFVAWGYWLCQVFANTAYAVIIMESLNYFFAPHFAGGNNLPSVIGATIVIWFFYALTIKGIKTAALVNLVGTIFKLIPIVVFIIVALIFFKFKNFMPNLFDNLTFQNFDAAALPGQIKNTMFITLWCFIGIETAVALSDRAKKHKDISKATMLSFVFCLVVYMLISLLPFGFLSREAIASFENPSTAGVLNAVIGKPGALIMIIGLIVSALFAWLSWFIIAAEVPFSAARAGASFPKQFGKQNRRGAPAFSLLVTALATQFAVMLAYLSQDAWNTMMSITGVMVMPVYIMTTLYLTKISSKKSLFPKGFNISKKRALVTGILGTIYAMWLIYAAGLYFLMLALIIFAAGVPVYIYANKQKRKERKA